jgi:hypothetical protein
MRDTTTPRGPFDTPEQVFAAAAALRDAVRAVDPDDRLAEQTRARWIDIRAHYIISTLTACGVELGEQDERTVRWMAAMLDQPETIVLLDWVKRARHAAELVAAEAAAEPEACGRCSAPFDPDDTAFDGRARYRNTLFCRGCIDQCHEADADHRCIICMADGAR